MVTSEELKAIEDKVVAYLDEQPQTKTRLKAGKIAAMALSRFTALVAVEETRIRLGDVGHDPQMPLPFDGEEEPKTEPRA